MKKLSLILLVLGLTLSTAWAATIGFIDVEKVFKSYKQTQKAQDEINNKMKDYKKQLAQYQQKIDNAKIDGKTQEEIDKLQEEMKKELDPKETEIRMLNEEKMSKIKKSIVASVEDISKELGIDVVVDKQVVIAGGIDITDQVVTKLNKAYQ